MDHGMKAAELFLGGYNCAQSVVVAFSDLTGLDESFSAKMASSFGGGMGRMREVCGAVSGMLMVAGILYGWSILKAPFSSEFNWSASDLAKNFTITMTTFCIGGFLGAKISKRFGIQVAILAAALLSCAGFMTASLLDGKNILMLYRTDDLGTKGAELKFEHWTDIVNCGYTWYRQGKVGGTTNGNINNSMLYPYTDPTSPAGGISIEGWKTLWAYCQGGVFTGDSYGFDPLNRGDVQVSTFYSSSLYGKVDDAASGSETPLKGALEPENWALVDIADGTYYIAEYIGILDRADRTERETEAVKAFAEWFGSAEVQAAWADEFDSYPCNAGAVAEIYGEDIPEIYQIKNFSLNKVEGTDMTYAEYVGAHTSEWTNIMTNLGFYWKDDADAAAEPDWDNLDWSVLTQKAE